MASFCSSFNIQNPPYNPPAPRNKRQTEFIISLQLFTIENLSISGTKLLGHLPHFDFFSGISCQPSAMCLGSKVTAILLIGEFCLLVELHWEGSAIKGATPSSLKAATPPSLAFTSANAIKRWR